MQKLEVYNQDHGKAANAPWTGSIIVYGCTKGLPLTEEEKARVAAIRAAQAERESQEGR